jgi:hypothetical protein
MKRKITMKQKEKSMKKVETNLDLPFVSSLAPFFVAKVVVLYFFRTATLDPCTMLINSQSPPVVHRRQAIEILFW